MNGFNVFLFSIYIILYEIFHLNSAYDLFEFDYNIFFNVGINEMNPSQALDVNGTIRCNNIIPDDISLPILTQLIQIESTDDLGSRFNFRVFDNKHLFVEGIFKELDQQQPLTKKI